MVWEWKSALTVFHSVKQFFKSVFAVWKSRSFKLTDVHIFFCISLNSIMSFVLQEIMRDNNLKKYYDIKVVGGQ